MTHQKEIVIILGMHRSGTSVLARSVNLMGFHLGKRVLSPAKDNPNGFWENDRVVKVNDSILKKLGLGWADYCALPENWEQMGCLDEEKTEIARLLESEFENSDRVVIKDPRLCRTCKLWFPILEDKGFSIKIVSTIRHPFEVAESLLTRNSDVHPSERLSKTETLFLWIRYVCESMQNGANYPRRTFVFPDFLETGEEFLDSLITFVSPNIDGLDGIRKLVLNNFCSGKETTPPFPTDNVLSRTALSIWNMISIDRHHFGTDQLNPEALNSVIADIYKTDALWGEIYKSWKLRTASIFSIQSKIEAPGQILRKISSGFVG